MDPFTIIAAAVAAGASSGLKGATSEAIKDAYHGLETIIKDVYNRHRNIVDSVEHLVKKPDDKNRRASLAEELKEAGPDVDNRLMEAAQEVIAAVKRDSPETAHAIGMMSEEFEAFNLHVKNLQAPEKGTAFQSGKVLIRGTATFDNIGGPSFPKP
jgi:hypothetical protein